MKNYSLSYSAACKFFLAININKNNQFIDWRKRPLKKDKILYAINDVKYLLPLYEKLNRELKRLKRNDKVNQLHKKILDPKTYTEKPKYAWRKLKFFPKNGEELEILKEICELREKVAIKKNLPIRWVIKNHEIKLLLMKKSSDKLKEKIIKKIKDKKLREKLSELIGISIQ
jgi:ribonuclease D